MTSIRAQDILGADEKDDKKTQTYILLTEYDQRLALGNNKHNNAEYKCRMDRKHNELYS